MEVEHLKNLGASLVREYLFRMGLKCTLKCMDDECPRSPKSFNNRILLARELRIEHLVHEYKQVNCQAKSVLEIVLDEFLRHNTNTCLTLPNKKYATTALARVSFEKWSKMCAISTRSRKVSVQRSKTIDSDRMVWFYRQLSDRGVKIDFPTLVHIYCDCFSFDQQSSAFQESESRLEVLFEQSKGRHKIGDRDEHGEYRDRRDEYDETVEEAMAFNRLNPKKYPPVSSKNALRDKEEILLDSLSAFRSRTSYDNRTRLGPDKENTFVNLRRSRSANAVAQLSAPSDPPFEPICDTDLRTKSQPDSLAQNADLKTDVSVENAVLPESSSISNQDNGPGLVSDNVAVERVDQKEKSIFSTEKVSMEEIEKHNLAVNELDDDVNTMSLPSLQDDAFRSATEEDIEPVVIQISSPKTKTKSCNLNRNIEECRVHKMYNNNNGNQNKLDDIEDAIVDEGGENLEFVPLRLSQAITLKKLILGSAIRSFPLQWMVQSFVLSSNPKLRYGLVQNKGGACGVLASVQGHLLKRLLFHPQTATGDVDPLRPTRQEARKALALALADILWSAGNCKQSVLVRSNQESHLEESLVYRPDGLTDSLLWRRFHAEKDLQEEVENHLDEFTSPLGKGCLRFVISAILSCGIQSVVGCMDDESTPLLGPTGMCSLELVNLLLTGRAVSNVFDNDVRLDTCLLRGVAKRSDIGFLSIFEHFNSCQVGSNLKTPRYPIWLVNSENHFSVVFSSVKQLVSDWRAERQFHLYHYDGLVSHEETVLAIDTTGFTGTDGAKKDNVPALELCIKTKWKDAVVHWSSNTS